MDASVYDHLDQVHSDHKVLKVIRLALGIIGQEFQNYIAQGTIRLKSTQIRWFSRGPGGRLACISGGLTQGLHSPKLRLKTIQDAQMRVGKQLWTARKY
jgi:hypothetical protein